MTASMGMLVVLDPAPFLNAEICHDHLNSVLQILDTFAAVIPQGGGYWESLQETVLPFARSDRRFLLRWQALERFKRTTALPLTDFLKAPEVRLGVLESGLEAEWIARLQWVLTASASSGHQTWFVTRFWEGRGLRWHRAGHSILEEKQAWQLEREGGEPIPVAATLRNVRIPWTSRFSDELPAEEDGAKFPFCPPGRWRSASLAAFKSAQQRYCWVDREGNYWGDPGTPDDRGVARKPYHWDLWLNKRLSQDFRKQLKESESFRPGDRKHFNIVRFGGPEHEGPPGEIHHPEEFRKRVKKGWKC